MAPVVLGYWKIRGLAQPIRLLLGYTGVDFEDKMYECGEAPLYDKSCWLDEKEKLGLDFPNLPYLIDGDIKISQSNAILRYIARKHGLDGKTEIEKIRVDMMENEGMDFRNNMVYLCYLNTPDTIKAKLEEYKIKVKGVLKRFEEFIEGRKFFASNEVTFVDFVMYELLDQHKNMIEGVLDPYVNLQNFMKNFEEIPRVAEFIKSKMFFKGYMNNPYALIR